MYIYIYVFMYVYVWMCTYVCMHYTYMHACKYVCWGVQRVGPLPLVLFSGEHFGTYILYHGAFLVETLTLRRRRDPLASAWPPPWGHAPGCPLSISTLTLTSKVTVSGQGHENGKISSAFFAANLCRIQTKLRTDADVDDPYRIMR